MKKFYRKIRKPLLIYLTYINYFVLILSFCALDSDSDIPYFTAGISWLFLIIRAKREGVFE